ncbi:Uma2 family endonuclease [Vasconcelosia minhoensis]|uniref:Uma2 family endonuclease n=1 Tax=Vasconcelosia minhoensis TaxID=3366354 RepID=UPI001D139374|nr:Uma2 family endonuclease [Romeria gracilis]
MVGSVPQHKNLPTDTWVQATWDEYAELAANPAYAQGRGYYESGEMRLEMAPLGPGHARDNAIVSKVVSLFATLKRIRIAEYANGTFRKVEIRDSQPDIAFYLGDVRFPPQNDEPVDVTIYGAPQLVVEIASTSLSDDLGTKRLLYERLGMSEYWVVNVALGRVTAFSIQNGRSGEVKASSVLPGLMISVVEDALKRSQTEDDGAINPMANRVI